MLLTPLEPQSHMWGQTTQISSSLSPKRDCGSKGVNTISQAWVVDKFMRIAMQQPFTDSFSPTKHEKKKVAFDITLFQSYATPTETGGLFVRIL